MPIRTRPTWQLIVLGIAGALGVAACASGLVREGEYRDQRFAVRMPPARWTPAAVDGAVLAFRASDLGAAIALRAECARPEPGPLSAVSRHLFFGLTDKRIVLQEAIAVPGGEGVRTRLHARLEERPVDVEGRTLRHGGCLYDFLYVAPPERFAEGAADFAEFARSWRPVFAP
jgi:hypothetical protein